MGGIRKNDFLMIGISHKTAPIEKREKFSFNTDTLSVALDDLKRKCGIRNCVILSTCNRTEIYAYISKSHDKVRENINTYILEKTGERKEYLEFFYFLEGTDVIGHLFEVASGLDSMIVGEPEIFGQVKYAYSVAYKNNCTNTALNRLFHHTFQVGKQIRNCTSIGEGAVSLSSSAVILAQKIFGSLRDRSVLLVGTGKIGKLCAKQLRDTGIDTLYISNRTGENAFILAKELSGEVVPYEEIENIFVKADIIITSIASPEPLITKNQMKHHMAERTGKPLYLIDLGVPRNIEPETAEIKNIHLFNIDNLENITSGNLEKRKSEAEKAKKIIKKEVDEYCTWINEREVMPAIQNLHNKCEDIRADEIEKIKNRVSPETYAAIDRITKRIVKKILHKPTVTMRVSESGETRERLIESINELFIDDSDNNNTNLDNDS
ncbi:glutamyl-tRNA reductase [Candidatus Latescibacterota bacterium]